MHLPVRPGVRTQAVGLANSCAIAPNSRTSDPDCKANRSDRTPTSHREPLSNVMITRVDGCSHRQTGGNHREAPAGDRDHRRS